MLGGIERLVRELETWRDPESGVRVVERAHRVEPGAFPDRAPDLLVGYSRGYRSSDESAIGNVPARELVDNPDKWSGDHCMDPSLVPGVLVSSRPLPTARAALIDLAPTILRHFDVPPLPEMEGRALFTTPTKE